MNLEFVYKTFLYIINPLLLYQDFLLRTYHFFFIFNLLIFIYFLFKHKKLIEYICNLITKSPPYIKIILVFIILLHVSNSIYSMQPVNSLVPVTLEQIDQAYNLNKKFQFNDFGSHTIGFPVMIAFTKVLFDIDYVYILSGLGIFFSSLIILLLFITIKHLTKNDPIALIGCITFISVSYVVHHTSSIVSALTCSSFFVLLLIFFYSLNVQKFDVINLILLLSNLLFYIRPENIIFIFIFIIYFFVNHKQSKSNYLAYMIGYLFFLPNMPYLLNYKIFINNQPGFIVGLSGIESRFLSFISLFLEFFSFLFLLLFIIGLIALFYKRNRFFLISFVGILSVYLTFQVYQSFIPKHFFNILPVIIVISSFGFYFLASIRIKEAIKFFFVLILWLLFIFNLIFFVDHHFFKKISYDESSIVPHLRASEEINGSKVLLCCWEGHTLNYQRFYANSEIFEYQKPYESKDFDYLVHITELPNPILELNKLLNFNLTLNNHEHMIYLYKIN